jgi:hypothetical protein
MADLQSLHDRTAGVFSPHAPGPVPANYLQPKAPARRSSEVVVTVLTVVELVKLLAQFAYEDRGLIWRKAKSMARRLSGLAGRSSI